MLDAAGHVPRGRETATRMALADAQLIAAMRRTATTTCSSTCGPTEPSHLPSSKPSTKAARRYGEYLRLKAQITLP